MDAIQKFRNHLDPKRKDVVDAILDKLIRHDFEGLDIKKLKGSKNIFRVRKGKIRITYKINPEGQVIIQKADFRNDTTYN